MLRDGNLAVMLPRRTAVALLALCGLIAVGDGESGVCVCHLSVCIYLFDRLLVCGERVCGQAVLCWTGQPGSHHGAVSGVCKPVICRLNHLFLIHIELVLYLLIRVIYHFRDSCNNATMFVVPC